jgi:ABC-type dipeptide/oligopeptide/nickel transport system permease subunit
MSIGSPSAAEGSDRELVEELVTSPEVGAAAVLAARPLADAGEVPAGSMPGWRLGLATFAENRLAVASLLGLVLIAAFCFIGPLIYHTNQVSANLALQSQPPSAAHLLGTTTAGFDELGRLMIGGQATLEVGLAVAILSTAFGLVVGLIAGYLGGLVDALLMRIVDAVLAIPFLFFVVLLASIVTPTLWLIILVITAVSWLSTARLVRAEALTLRTREYVKAAEGVGSRRTRILFRHITPNLLGVLSVNASLKVADAILIYVAMTYLGLGLPPPATDWGTLLTEGITNLFDGYWWQLWPAAFLIVATVLAVSILGDGLRDVAEGRLRRR